jgi:sugar phosphate permease
MSPLLRIFPAYAAGYFLSYLLRNANAVMAPELTRELGLSSAQLGLLTSAYLLAFGAFQMPLGILLDRYGPRRVDAALLLVSAAGSALFGLGDGLPQLALARAAIGLGASASLMSAFKAFTLWFPVERQTSLNAAVMVMGSLGALSATTPLSMTAPLLGWRGVFLALGGLSLATAVAILATPERARARSGET